MKSHLKTALALTLACGAAAWGQMTRTQIENIPFPPPKAFTGAKAFNYVGDWYYTTTPRTYPTTNIYGRSLTYSDYDYYLLSNTRNKRVFVSVAYGGTTPTTQGNCLHSHVSYGVKGKYTMTYAGYTYEGWAWTGGGTLSGVWNSATGRCSQSVNNTLRATDPIFGWGQDYIEAVGTSFSSGTTRYIDALMVGVVANTHGTGDCLPKYNPATGRTFQECLDAVKLQTWTSAL